MSHWMPSRCISSKAPVWPQPAVPIALRIVGSTEIMPSDMPFNEALTLSQRGP